MAKKHVMISSKFLGIALLIALIIDNISILRGFDTIATIIYILVAVYLLFLN